MDRRQWLQWGLGSAGLLAGAARAQKVEALPELRIVIPASLGGGWDQTGRELGAALLSARLVDKVAYENIGGKAGTIGLAQFVERYNTAPNTLLMGGMVMLGGIALQQAAIDTSKVTPMAELTSDYLVVAVPAASPIKTISDLVKSLRQADFKATCVGGSAGGVDHMLMGMMLRAARAQPENYNYLATAGGAEAVKALQEGRAQIGISGMSEFRPEIESGRLRALAISSRKGRMGLPSLRESGLDTELANWRGVFAPKGISEPQRNQLATLLDRVSRTAEWNDTLRRNNWVGSYRAGPEFAQFVETEQTMARVVVHMLRLKS